MCGIAGYLGPRHEALGGMAARMAQCLYHRGPDDGGEVILNARSDRMLMLVHRRLAIVDLSVLGRQPMHDPQSGNWLVFNGEIYNFRELRRVLEQHGVAFRSHSDTEVLLKGLATRGRALLDELCGMFAFANWDAARHELMLAVDPLGIKPLYYWQGPGGEFVFASELRTILSTGLIPRRIDPVGLETYLTFGAVQGPGTIIEGVRVLLPGTFMVISADGATGTPQAYWTPPFPTAQSEPVRKDFDDQLRAVLDEVIQQHLISDVPLGAFLSGGIDSSAIVALASPCASSLRTFSVTFDEKEFSEAPYSRQVAAAFGTQHTELRLTESDMLNMLPDALEALDQPSFDGTNVYVISKAVREAGLTVALSGQGGDEVFGGYSTFRRGPALRAWCNRLSMVPRSIRRGAAALCACVPVRSAAAEKLAESFSGEPNLFAAYSVLRQNFLPRTRRALFPAGAGLTSAEGLPNELAAELHQCADGLDEINQVSLLELRTYLANMLLRDGDVMSMAHALEIRVPFLDRRVVEMVARLCGTAKMNPRLPKPLLLGALKGALPPAIYRRPKQGFHLPWFHWLRNQLRPMAEEALHDTGTFAYMGIDPLTVKRLWNDFLSGRPRIGWARIWSLIVLREWSRRNLLAN